MTIIDTTTVVPSTFVPAQIDQENGLFVLPILICPICNLPILNLYGIVMSGDSLLRNDVQAQLQRANWRLPSNMTDANGHVICNVDAAALSAPTTFSCYSCGQTQPINSIQAAFGTLNPTFLCQACYGRIPAKQWMDMVNVLTLRHAQDPPAPLQVRTLTLAELTAHHQLTVSSYTVQLGCLLARTTSLVGGSAVTAVSTIIT